MQKPVEKVLSGEQIVTDHGTWDRVHGVSAAGDGVVLVRSDEHSSGRPYLVGTDVTIV
jgi:hypothetical protein